MSAPLLHFALLAFVSLFTMVNPLGVVPVYISMTAPLSPHQSRAVAFKATLTAFLVMMLFALTGQLIFRFFHISINSLRIVGGVLFFSIGYEMLQARLTRTKHDEERVTEYIEDIAITPLGVPMICGPGTITTAVLLMNESTTMVQRGTLLLAMVVVSALTYTILVSGRRVVSALGTSGNKVLTRLMGLIVMVIAVEFFFAGLTPIVRGMLAATGTPAVP